MGRFTNSSAAQHEEAADNSSFLTPHSSLNEGIDLHLRFRPNDTVLYLTERGVKQERIIRVKTTHRSLVSTSYQPEHTVTIVMESGTERREDECFASREELSAWIMNSDND